MYSRQIMILQSRYNKSQVLLSFVCNYQSVVALLRHFFDSYEVFVHLDIIHRPPRLTNERSFQGMI